MSQHPSLRSSDKDKQHRSVLKRHERLKILKDKEKWRQTDSVFGLQKVKVLRFKIKKEKAAKEVGGLEAALAAPGAEVAPGTQAQVTRPATGKEATSAQAGTEPKKTESKK